MKYTVALLLTFLFSLPLAAQLDPRERYGTYLGGGVAKCFDYNYNYSCNGALSSTGPATTRVSAVTVDASGNIYVAGDTTAADFPTTASAYSKTVAYTTNSHGPSLSNDSFAAKFSPSGQLLWSTYLGLPLASPINAISADASGNITVVGTLLISQGCECGSNTDAPFIVKLNSTGSARTYYNEPFPVADENTTQTCAASGNLISPVAGAAIDPLGQKRIFRHLPAVRPMRSL